MNDAERIAALEDALQEARQYFEAIKGMTYWPFPRFSEPANCYDWSLKNWSGIHDQASRGIRMLDDLGII